MDNKTCKTRNFEYKHQS